MFNHYFDNMRYISDKQMNKRTLRVIFIILFSLIPFFHFAQSRYFVRPDGNDNLSGTDEQNAWRSITYALSGQSPLNAGDTLYVKAGHYTGENILVEKNGTPTHPIVVCGYKDNPGDITGSGFDYGQSPDPQIMPLIDGEDRTTGTGIDIDGSRYIQLKNLQITRYENGIVDYSYQPDLFAVLDHIILTEMGDVEDDYSGKAVEFCASHNQIKNCTVINSSAQGILVEGDNNLIENCKVYCDDATSDEAATDYYIIIYYGSHNTVKNCYVERIGDLPHYGHGIGIKGDGEYNLITHCTAVNFRDESFYVRHRGAKYNTFEYCHVLGITQDINAYIVRDGASYNTFNNCSAENCKRGFMFEDSTEDEDAQYCGSYNRFNNCLITDTEIGIDFNDYELESNVENNSFFNCLFHNGEVLINVERYNDNNRMVNTVVSRYQALTEEFNGYTLSFEFDYCLFHNNGFSTPAGTSNITGSPFFTDEWNQDFHLSPQSLCIDAGTSVGAPDFDYEGTPRPQNNQTDIGIYEYHEFASTQAETEQPLLFYPNPARDKIYISRLLLHHPYRIYSSDGRMVRKGKIDTPVINLSGFPPGIYYLISAGRTGKIVIGG